MTDDDFEKKMNSGENEPHPFDNTQTGSTQPDNEVIIIPDADNRTPHTISKNKCHNVV